MACPRAGSPSTPARPRARNFPRSRRSGWSGRAQGANSIVVHALLDSKSAAGSYRFTIRPGATTIFDVEMALYPRVDVPHGGLAPLTSMFLFGPNDRAGVADFRPQVHDSDGLMMLNGRGEELWRPLSNPHNLQVSAFADTNPRSFGLVQRDKRLRRYQDLESHFEKRPSLVVEPIGDWGEGEVVLFEIPTKEEIHDNIAAFWRPKQPAAAKSEHIYTYRLHWGPDLAKTDELARFTRTGLCAQDNAPQLFVLELAGERLKTLDSKAVKGIVTADKGEMRNIVTQPNPETGGWRLSFQVGVKDQTAIELRAYLNENDDGRFRDLDLSMDGLTRRIRQRPRLICPKKAPLALGARAARQASARLAERPSAVLARATAAHFRRRRWR